MKWLTLEDIKAQCRIEQDFHEEDSILEMYGESAEDTIIEYCGRTFEDVVESYGKVPTNLRHASLMLVDLSYQQRSPISAQNMSIVPYTFDLLIKPYVKL